MTHSAVFRAIAVPALAFGLATGAAEADPRAILTFGLGAAVIPAYPGADDYTVGPGFAFGIDYLRLGRSTFGSTDPLAERTGFGLRGSVGYVASREAADHPELAGLNDIDASIEVGLGFGYEAPGYRVFLDFRQGITGHEALVAELGADVKLRATDRLSLAVGPRMTFGSDRYAATYFGVTAAEASSSAFPAFAAEGGLISAGVELGMNYRFNDDWGLQGAVTYDRLQNDAAASPITAQGSRDQFGAKLVLTRRITFDF